jgi:hypothetical protein
VGRAVLACRYPVKRVDPVERVSGPREINLKTAVETPPE